MENYYEILGIEENSTQEQIKKQYRKLSKEFHPDVNPSGAEKFKKIAEAYETLSDEQKRKQYDFKRKNPFGGGGHPFDDILSSFFGGQNPFEQRRQPQAPSKVIKIKITPIESFLGSEKNIKFTRNTGCQTCKGSGGDQQRCGGCNGVGFKIKTFGTGFMVQQVQVACETCGGRGHTLIHRCMLCGGSGVETKQEEVRVKLPVGIDNGQFLKLQGYGDFNSGVMGDLVLQIEVEPTDGFEKMDNDLIYTLFLNLDGLKDGSYNIPHPHGNLNVKAPKVFDTSVPLRLKGKGYNGGDMYVKMHVKFERD